MSGLAGTRPEGSLNRLHDVFISYNSQDKDAALELDEELRTLGYHPWIDVRAAFIERSKTCPA